MKVTALTKHSNMYELRNKGFLRSIKLLNDDIHTTRDSFVSINNESLTLVLSDIRGTQITLEIPLNEIQRLYELVRAPDYSYPIYKQMVLDNYTEPNILYMEMDDDGIEVLSPSASTFQYEYTYLRFKKSGYVSFGTYLAKVNGDYLVLINNEQQDLDEESLVIFDLLSIISALITVQSKFSFGHLSMRSMSFELPPLVRNMDNDVILYGTSAVFYANDLVWSVQDDLINCANNLSITNGESSISEVLPYLHYPVIDISNYSHIKLCINSKNEVDLRFVQIDEHNYKPTIIPLISSINDETDTKLINITNRNIRVLDSKAWITIQSILEDTRINNLENDQEGGVVKL